MKKILLAGLLSIGLYGCGLSNRSCFDAVKKQYSTCKDCQFDQAVDYIYLIRRPDGSVQKIKTMNITNTDITDSSYIFLPIQQTQKQ